MILRRLTANLKAQNWTAITIEFVIVVVGVFIGMQVTNWNQQRIERRETQRMLEQLGPEIDSQIAFFKADRTYYATTRHFADLAFAGWRGDPVISDEQFVVAAYQASQITGSGINADAWSLTFGGDQLRNIADPNVRRNLELLITSDYSTIDSDRVATRYREQVRHVIPIDIQDEIRRRCGDRPVRAQGGADVIVLPATCPLRIEPKAAAAAAAALRARGDLVGELHWHLAAVANHLANARALERRVLELDRALSATP